MVVPRGGGNPHSSAPLGCRKFVIDDCFSVLVAFEVTNLGPGLTVLSAHKVKLCNPLIVFTTTLSGNLCDELTLAAEVNLEPLVLVIETSAP